MSSTTDKYRDYVITSFVKSVQPIVVERAQGAVVTDTDGRDYIDCFAGIAVVNAGHCNPEVIAAARAQMEKLVHCCSYVYHVQPVADLAEKMAEITPGRLRKSFFANSGAEAIEGAMKLAKLYTGRTEFVALNASFHGRTWGALSVTGNAGRKGRGGPYAPGVAFAPVPYTYRSDANPEECAEQCARALEDVLRFSTSGDVAAFIAEPLLGEGGIIIPPLNYFKQVKRILDKHGILFIADEVQTGFARTGAMFALEHYGVEPDIVVTAKGIADGFPLGAFTTRDEIAASFRPGDHLSTFGGNPVSCAAALANINFIQREGLAEKALHDGEFILGELADLKERFSIIGEVRGMGLMIGIELVSDAALTPAAAQAEAIREYCLRHGVLVGVGGVYGNVVRIQPPLVISREQIDQALDVLGQALSEVSGRGSIIIPEPASSIAR
ncbi:MAG TPA: aspartate aminotransferase family protein [Chloroflexia bacterium]|nr:aspartate aminotransferase family protein [Chloroflexia bacterium]